ncbi:uromodulin-like 1 [Crotalus adamanteus]|uniref:Uromodulin-like 1 n=1 Tax=Crotalus adamanteus TaxID=8729 RepID=A0AAW1BJQ4_CROAD
MRNSFILLSKILVTFVFILCITSAESASNTFTEKGLSLLGYHLCNYSVIKIVSKTVAYQKSYEKQTPCGGWIPWKMCTTTYYKEEYHPIMVQEAVNVTDCCAGYEQVGPYCSLPINRSSEFASRPGACPTKIGEALKSSCVSDMDCPEYKKCCKTSMGTHCSDPVPEEQTVTKYWYDVSVLVKMDFSELNKVDPKLLNHSRLLHSMITGALWPMNISVYHIQTKSETYADTLVSYVLVGLPQLVPLVNISSLLKEIVKRVYEVIDIVVQDCDPDMPNILIKNKYSSNLLRSSRSASPEIHGSVDLECDSPPIRNHKIFNVTCSSFEASWSVNSLQNHSFRAEVYKGKKLVERMETTDMKLTMLNLEAGVMYTMDISYEACGKNITSSRTVKTGEIVDPVTTQGSNVTDNTTTPFSMAEIQAVTSFTKYTEATVLPSSGTQESSTLPAEKALSASQKMNVSGHVRNDSILNSPETATPAPKWDIGGNDSFWSDERNSTASPSSFKANISLATDLSAPFPAERIFFSNVTNTSFQISWTTHFSANTTFHVLLFEEELLIKKVKTQSSHLNISELKAGTLYTVKIKADLYGNESKTVQRKVKTAAQKFNGMVRIVNLNYSSEFSNSRSEKRQNFSKMFLNEVRTSLPPNILQKMDAGMINISIVSIIPGSIVVNYSLLIPIDMDARNVSGSLLEAFRNSSRFEVDNNSLSIYDNNECEREETDCSPNATCYNIYGSYGCKCKEGFVNVNAERPGRNCEVLSSSLSSGDAQSKEWSSTALPLTDLYTSDPMPSSAGDNFSTSSSRSLENATANTTINKKTINRTTNIHDLPQNSSLINGSSAVSIKEAVQVLCEFEKIVISIKKDFLHQQSIPESSLYLGNPRCNVTSSNSSHVVLHTDWNECETEIQTNTTHTIAKTVLRNDYSSHRIIHHLKISSQIHCTFENNLLTSSGYTSEGIYTIFEDLHGSGHFLTEMRLFIGNSPIPQNFSISGSDNVMIEVGVQTRSKKLKLVVGQCWATPTNNSMDPHSFHFIHGSCPVPNTNTIVIANGISNRARFKLKIFSFVNSSVVYLHCKIKICVEIPKSTCRTNCQGFRFWKSGEIIATPKATWGPLHKFNAGLKEEKKSGLGVGYIVLIVIGPSMTEHFKTFSTQGRKVGFEKKRKKKGRDKERKEEKEHPPPQKTLA